MKSENGRAKTILIATITVLVVAFFAVLVVFKFKGPGKDGDNNQSANKQKTETMTYIEETDKEYVFIDSNGNVRKLKKDSVGTFRYSLYEGDILYQNSILVKKDDKYAIIDFDGKKLYETEQSIDRILQSEDAVLYRIYENGDYGVVNAKGEVIVPAEYDDMIEQVNSSIDNYVYAIDYSSDMSGKKLTIFNSEGKKVYEAATEFSTLFAEACIKTKSGVNLIVNRKNETTLVVVNLNTGEEIYTLTDNGDHTIKLSTKGNATMIESYIQGTYGSNEGDDIVKYYWFDENGKVSKKIDVAENDSLYFESSSSDSAYAIYSNASNEYIAVDKYGKEVYKTTGGSLSQVYYTNEITGNTISYINESLGGKKYQTINSEGKVVFEGKVGVVGNKYFSVGTTLYKHDGTKYIENAKGYKSVYNLDIIKMEDKFIIENQEGKSVEKGTDFELGERADLLDESTIVLQQKDKKITIINMDDLSMKELDFGSDSYVFIKNGYIAVSGKDSGYEYYNSNGDKIYTKSKK